MKKIQILSFLLFAGVIGNAQTNTFPTSGNVGIGSVTPMEKLDVTGNIFLRNMENLVGGGVGILFTSYGNSHPGPRIKSYLDYASGEQSRSRLVLSSYYGGYKDELTLMGGNVGIGIINPDEKLVVAGGIKTILDPIYPAKNVARVIPLGFSGPTGAQNWAIRGVYQYGNGVGLNADGGDLDVIKSLNGNTILATKSDGTTLGNVGIGTTDPKGYKLAVAGNMIAESVKVQLQSAWPDYVFNEDYKLTSLQETEKHIKEKGHLPGIPSAAEVKSEGIDLGEMNKKLLQKIEELTLYILEQNKRIEKLEHKIEKPN
ncbi:hypothetical protein DBR11_22730 [Pedobacter sp. HMWF019]|uniref:hypothetical protein n=1 Tax=Pedobacter sp. HMWF019 TaxID=2056856 RepID=UPI000D357940|nr:hypothetical protein [Pedobacter sp. HMWF019]PTS94694.1 hypothetical protein DBR11_22730 [Pedobacter sp. HMWF019]